MKTHCISTLAFLVISAHLFAGEPPSPPKLSTEFDRMKSLVGTWNGKADMGQGMMGFTVEYRLISGGTAIEERIFAGTPKEMLTIYHDRKGKLALTHYCMLGNQPGMALKSADSKSMHFDFDPKCGVDEKSEMHMHALTITFDDTDTITQDWKLFQDGKMKESHPFTLKRVKV
jgi:hypothetical protein